MDGSAVLRGLGRAIGVGGASARVGIGSALQQVAAPKKSRGAAAKASVSSSSSCYVAPEEERFVDDWEFAEEEGLQTRRHQVQLDQQPLTRDRIIFGTVPTRQEVLEATSDLQNALKQTIIPVSNPFGHESVSSSLSSVHGKPDSEISNLQDTDNRYSENLVNQIEPEFGQDNDEMLQKSGHSNVFEAFNLFQSNSSVQGMVISLASDEAVWEAVLKNEKVIEFRQQLLKDESESLETNKDTGKPSPGKHPFIQAIETVKAKVIELNLHLPAYLTKWITSTSWRLFTNGMVTLLASHEAVWEAVLKNDKATEFRQQLLKDESELSETNKDTGKHPFVQALETVKAKVIEYMDIITELCNQILGVVDKGGLLGKDPEVVKALKASWMLCIAVLLIVLVKRI